MGSRFLACPRETNSTALTQASCQLTLCQTARFIPRRAVSPRLHAVSMMMASPLSYGPPLTGPGLRSLTGVPLHSCHPRSLHVSQHGHQNLHVPPVTMWGFPRKDQPEPKTVPTSLQAWPLPRGAPTPITPSFVQQRPIWHPPCWLRTRGAKSRGPAAGHFCADRLGQVLWQRDVGTHGAHRGVRRGCGEQRCVSGSWRRSKGAHPAHTGVEMLSWDYL